MDTRLLLPPAKAATVQFPPSCPVVFFRSLVTCDDTGKSSSANTQHHGTAVGLGIVRSVFIDLSPHSGRQLIYDVEVLAKRNKKDDMPGSSSPANTSCASAPPGTTDVPVPANDTVEKFELPEWSLRYAPNCPALFDLSCLNEDDDLPAEQSSAIIPNVVGTTPSAARGIILCGLPTPCEDGDGIAFVYSALIHHDEESQYYEVHDVPLHYIRFDPLSMNQQGHKKDYIDAGTDQDMERKKLTTHETSTTHDTSNDFNAETKSAEDSSSPKATSNRNSKSSRRDRDVDPSPSKKSRSSRDGSGSKESRGDRKGDRKDQRKKDRRDRSSSPHKSSRRRDRRSRSGSTSLSRDRVSRSSRSRKHSYSSRSSRSNRSRSRSRDRQRSRSHERRERPRSRRGRSPDGDRSRQVAIPRWMDIDNVVHAIAKNQHRFQEGLQGFVASVANFRVNFSLDAVTVDPDLSQANLPDALSTIKEKLCELVKDDGAYHRLVYELAVFDIEKTGHYDGGPVCVVDPLPPSASLNIDHERRWRMILGIPYCQRNRSFHGLFLLGANGSRVRELEKQCGCRITVFGLAGSRYLSRMCRPYVSIQSKQESNVAQAAGQIRAIFREHQKACDCVPRM